MENRELSEYLDRQRARYGERFDPSELAEKFKPYFRTGTRIRVRTCDMEITGTVGVTTGWRPCFLLMFRSNSMGSPWTLSDRDEILAVKVGRKYVPVKAAEGGAR